jgi:hypothetical protein
MSHLSFYLLLIILFFATGSFSQKRWDGGGGDNRWNNGLNWNNNSLPAVTDNVVLDNTFVTGTYSVVLPPSAVTVKSITLSPSAGKTIDLILPPQNTLAPGLIVKGPGYGMVINSRGIFRNSSGASSGNAVSIADSIKIANNGTYIHNSASGHAANVQVLSGVPGTEQGIFEWNVPSASSTISLSGRTFGSVRLNAAGAGGNCNYTATGAAKVKIRGDITLGTGVTLALNFSDSILVSGNLTQNGGTLNLGTSIKSVAVQVGGDISQASGAVITESGSGTQSIVLANTNTQLLSLHGTIQNNVVLVKKSLGLSVLKSTLSLPFKLSLKLGSIITSDQWLLTLKAGCAIDADTVAAVSFIDGPLKKEGLNNAGFLFPVGHANRMRWLRLEQATGDFTVEYIKGDPAGLSDQVGSGIDHVSALEYWNVESAPGAGAVVKLSFADPYSGGVTNLSALRVGRLVNGVWQNAGNTGYAGTAGSNGWVSSSTASGFSANTMSFALASAMGQENPLPLLNMSFNVTHTRQWMQFDWRVKDDALVPSEFELQESDDGKHFSSFKSMPAVDGQIIYSYRDLSPHLRSYYRVRMRTATGAAWYESLPVFIEAEKNNRWSIEASNMVNNMLHVAVSSDAERDLNFYVCDAQGRVKKFIRTNVRRGSSLISVYTGDLRAGLYLLYEGSGIFHNRVLRFMKN